MRRVTFSAVALMGLALPAVAAAEQLTIKVPLNLTQLSPDLVHVYVKCRTFNGNEKSTASPSILGRGSLAMTVTIYLEIGPPTGTTRAYECVLEGETVEYVRMKFSDTSDTTAPPAFRLSVKPPVWSGTYVW